ncbi:ubiquinol oxidase subunit II [Candidatus Tachikawaea gelatinosa]|uniref:Ubiquinol oxidase subunit 2 n=1 Tax=Candidatus Tachikawaea gelatinosa TaxID=1410383 RepID=A0A090ASH7_9ENTR|nr:ubiquinol oxidase subunit II [Candidatus Tachikawaea gelatinosa]BAP58825.1 ubiquinol oxidase subunit II [Candidatus Tachikawaea gelatinosa]
MSIEKHVTSYKFILVTIFSCLLLGCDNFFVPKGQIATEQKYLILISLSLMLIIVIPVIFMIIAFAWKYRSSNKSAKYTPNWSKSHTIEIIVWTVPIIIIICLGIITWKSTKKLEPSKPLISSKNPIEINVIAMNWKWLFIYPKEKIATINQIVFPINVPLVFNITSNSVMNSFFIPSLGSQIYAMAGMKTKLYLIANKAGKYRGISSNFSGNGFSNMKFEAIGTNQEKDFKSWIEKVKQSKNKLENLNDFSKLEKTSEDYQIKYFSIANPDLFSMIIHKFEMNHKSHHINKN